MTAMNCQTSRDLFSEHFDHRVKGDGLTKLLGHLASCTPCRVRWESYSQVFDLVATSPEPEALRSFERPPEPPGSFPYLSVRGGWRWKRAAIAASILLLIGSNVLVFLLGQNGFQDRGLRGLPSAPVPGLVATDLRRTTRERWRDHLDLTAMTLHQFARLGPDAAKEGNELARAKLPFLEIDELRDSKRNDLDALDDARAFAPGYLRAVRNLTAALREHLRQNPARAPSTFLGGHPRILRNLEVAMRSLWAELSGEACGTSWIRRGELLRNLPGKHSKEVHALLQAEAPFLTARYSQAERNYRSFLVGFPKGKLDNVARLMLVETLGRMRRPDEARILARGLTRPKVRLTLPFAQAIILVGPRSPALPQGGMQIFWRAVPRLPGQKGMVGPIFKIYVPPKAPTPLKGRLRKLKKQRKL